MGAVLSLTDYPHPSRRMKIPLQSEVARYMEEKMGWPASFCLYYAQKFWHYYNAQGWKLSNGNAMKDWRSAFNAQWQRPKFKEDTDRLNECLKAMWQNEDEAVRYLDLILQLYKTGLKPAREDALKIWNYLRPYVKFDKETTDEILKKAGNDKDTAKLWALKYVFDHLIKAEKTFKEIIK